MPEATATLAHTLFCLPPPPPQLDETTDPVRFKADPKFSFPHPYPPTKLMFIPDKARLGFVLSLVILLR